MSKPAAPASSHKDPESPKRIRFPSLQASGALLSQKLHHRDPNSIVLAIARGGTPVGREVATRLGLPFDLLLIKRLISPQGPGSELCAVSIAGQLTLDDGIKEPVTPSTPIEYFLSDALDEFRRREELCRGGRPPKDLSGKQIILVDCAIHTGSTMNIAIAALRKLNPARIICAVPVSSADGYAIANGLADELISLVVHERFGHAGIWYENFKAPDD